MQRSRRKLLGTIGAIFLVDVATATRPVPLIAVVDESSKPFTHGDASAARGLYAELLLEAFGRMGVPIEVRAYPWRRAQQMAERGEAAIAGIYQSSERLALYDFSEPLFVERLLVYTPKHSALQFKDVEDLVGKHIGAVRGWSYGEAFDSARRRGRLIADEAPSDEANFQKLQRGRIDALVTIDATVVLLLDRLGLRNEFSAQVVPLTAN